MDLLITAIGSYVPPQPSRDKYKVTRRAVVKAERNAKGKLIGEFIRWAYTVEFGYSLMSETEYNLLCDALKEYSSTTFFNIPITFWSPQDKGYLTGYFYSADIAGDLCPNNLGEKEYQNVEIEIIEM